MGINRRRRRQITVGNVKIGGDAPICIQSMTKTDTCDVIKTVNQITELEIAGCQIVRVAVKDPDSAKAIKAIKSRINIPLVADIHFDYRLALLAIQSKADKIRLNPGNILKQNEIEAVVKAAEARHIPIRIGVNSGSVRSKPTALAMVKAALGYVKLFEKLKFNDIIISLKASDILTTIEAYRQIARRCDYPLHLGITAAGSGSDGLVKSAIGIAALLLEGIGDTIRVSLTGEPVLEVEAAKKILEAVGLRSFGPQIISCPTCGRCQVNLVKIVEEFKNKLSTVNCLPRAKSKGQLSTPPPKVAVMGCEVNGPGEAKDADIGIAAGKASGILFKKGKPVRKVAEKDFVSVLLEEIKKI